MHAIPEFQTGAAGGFSSPFVTLQLGGQMFGDIATAFAASIEKVTSKHETEADLAGAQAEYQRRREEWQHELDLLAKEKAQVDKRIAETQLKLEIAAAELRRHELEVDNSRKVQAYFRDKYTNEQLYGWMLGQLSTVYFQAYKVAFDAAQQAERAFRFERGDASSSFIEFSYWDSLKKGLLAGERLLLDLRRLEAAHVEGDRRALEVTRHISLREDFPLALVELLATGRCQIDVTEALLDGDFPGHYFRRVKTVSLTVSGALKPLAQRQLHADAAREPRSAPTPTPAVAYAQSADARGLAVPRSIRRRCRRWPPAGPTTIPACSTCGSTTSAICRSRAPARSRPGASSCRRPTTRIDLSQRDRSSWSPCRTPRGPAARRSRRSRAPSAKRGWRAAASSRRARHSSSVSGATAPALWKRLEERRPGRRSSCRCRSTRSGSPGAIADSTCASSASRRSRSPRRARGRRAAAAPRSAEGLGRADRRAGRRHGRARGRCARRAETPGRPAHGSSR